MLNGQTDYKVYGMTVIFNKTKTFHIAKLKI